MHATIRPRVRHASILAAALGSITLLGACVPKAQDLVWLPRAKPASVLVRNVGVLDVATGRITAARDVLLSGGRIHGLGPTGSLKTAEGATVIDGVGATLLPGLIDMHGHTGNSPEPSWLARAPDPERNLRAYLYCGVTTVFDPASMAPQGFERRDDIAAGKLLGPTLYTTGPMLTAHGGHPVPIIETLVPWFFNWYLIPRLTRQIGTPDEARAAVQELAGLHADAIKVTLDRIPEQAPELSRDLARLIVDEARAQQLRTVAHVGTFQDALDAGAAGVALWVHHPYKDALTEAQAAQLAAFRIPMVPTLYVFEAYALLGVQPRVATPLEQEIAAAEILAEFDRAPKDSKAAAFFRGHIEKMRTVQPHWRDNVRRLRAAGVTILAGSDAQMGVFPGAALHRELVMLTEAGMTPAEAIRAATLDAARFLANRPDPDFGVVAEGKVADLLLVDGDPTADLAALSRIRTVFKGGVPLERRPIGGEPPK